MCSAMCRENCRTARSSARRWRVRWSAIRTCSCSTIPCATWTPSCATKCVLSCRACCAAAVLYVTQDYREAMAIADRIAVLIDGRLEQVASPDEVYGSPASVAVARLFGDPSINLAEIAPIAEHGTLFAAISGAKVPLGLADALPADRPYWLGVRPEDLGISFSGGDDAI